ncbi:hypothetical protein K438DRAFT_2025924 [Mycena galopus ATCC 62051]|nr:hypothetical protein K438DRAFT_2025924 [Mycena galopus ATCC 62051]
MPPGLPMNNGLLAPSLRPDRRLGVEQPGRDVVRAQALQFPSISLIPIPFHPQTKLNAVLVPSIPASAGPRPNCTRPPASPLPSCSRGLCGPHQHMLGLLRKGRCHHPGILAFPVLPRAALLRNPAAILLRPAVRHEVPARARVFLCASDPAQCLRHPRQYARYACHPHAALAHLVATQGKQCLLIKGLFFIVSPSPSVTATCVLCVPLPPPVSTTPSGSAHGDERTITTDDDNRDDERLTPVPASMQWFGNTERLSLRVISEPSPPSLGIDCDTPPAYTYKGAPEAELRTLVSFALERRCCSEPDNNHLGRKRNARALSSAVLSSVASSPRFPSLLSLALESQLGRVVVESKEPPVRIVPHFGLAFNKTVEEARMDPWSAAQVIEPENERREQLHRAAVGVLAILSASAGPRASHLATRTPADVSVPSHFVVLTNARLASTLPSPTLYDSDHRADDVLGVLFSRADAPPPTPPPIPRSPSSPKPREDDARPSKACSRAALLHNTQAIRFRTKLGREDRVRVLVRTGHSRTDRAPGFLATRTHVPLARRGLFLTVLFAILLCSSVLGGHETHPRSLPPLASAALNKSLAPTANDSVRDANELTVTADDDRVASSINPPSLRVNCEPPSLGANCEALPSLRINCDAPAAYTYDYADADGAEQRTPGATRSGERRRQCHSSASQSWSWNWTMRLPWWTGSGNDDARALFPSSTLKSVRQSLRLFPTLCSHILVY